PFDITKIWKHTEFPLIEVGVLELNRNPENYFADVEQAAFDPGHVVPGIGFAPDKFFQGRLFAYGDAHRYRLGVNAEQIPVNRAKNEVHSYHRDGSMRVDGNSGGSVNYTPNSYGVLTAQPEFTNPALDLEGAGWAYDPKDDPTDDNFRAGGDLYRLMTEDKRALLIENTARNIAPVTENIKYRHTVHCYWGDPEYGTRMAAALGLDLHKVQDLAKGNQTSLVAATMMA
ncbi:MAG: catalase, partial [Pseudoflavonifractor sp.]